jgi:hypothetical protein
MNDGGRVRACVRMGAWRRLLKAAIKEWKARRAAEALPAGEADTALAAEESIAAPEEAAAASEGSSKDEL